MDVPHPTGLGTYREAVSFPLAAAESVADVERFPWPRPEDWDCSGLRAPCDEWRDYPLLCGSSEPFYHYCRLRGMEQALSDLIENQALAERSWSTSWPSDGGRCPSLARACWPGLD